MNLRCVLLRTIVWIPIAASAHAGQAQVFIPDTVERAWLNGYIPGIVDASGIMDTLDPGIANLDTAVMLVPSGGISTVSLHGVMYLDSLHRFTLGSNNFGQHTDIFCNGLPHALKGFTVINRKGSINLPQLPEGMDYLWAHGYADTVALNIAGLPDSLPQIRITDIADLDWAGECWVGILTLDYDLMSDASVIVPPINAYAFSLYGSVWDIDISAVATTSIHFFGVDLAGTTTWPPELEEFIWKGGTYTGSLGVFPPSLRAFFIGVSNNYYCVPCLPDSLVGLTIANTILCLPNWPTALDSADIDFQWILEGDMSYCTEAGCACSTDIAEWQDGGARVYPDPAGDQLWITLPNDRGRQIDYAVRDLICRNVLTGVTKSDAPIDVSGLPPGVFVLTAKSSERTFSIRFVKQ